MNYMEHDPRISPQRPQIGVSADGAPLPSLPTAMRLSDLAVLVDPHSGHLIFVESRSAARTSWSNFALHFPHVYS